jgi:hypothetical protein
MKSQLSSCLMETILRSICLLFIIVGIGSIIFGSTYSVYLRMPFPFRDMIEIMEFFDSNPSIWLGSSFTKLHSMEHRPAIPAFIWYADRIWFGSSGLMPLLVSHVALAATALLAVWQWSPRFSFKALFTWVIPVAAVALMFSLSNWINLMWEMQLHVAMSLLFVMLSANFAGRLSLPNYCSKISKVWLDYLLMVTMAFLATFSFGYGLPIILVITIHGILVRWPRRQVIFTAVISFVFVEVYLYFLSLRDHVPIFLDEHPYDLFARIAYIARFLAGSLADINFYFIALEKTTLTLIAGLIILGLYIFYAGRLYFLSLLHDQPPSRTQTVALIVTSTCVAISLMTCLSRPLDTEGLVWRYYIVSTLFILSLPGLFMPVMDENYIKIKYPCLLMLASLFIILSLFGHQANKNKVYNRWHSSAVAAISADMKLYLPDNKHLIGPPLHQSKNKTLKVWATHKARLQGNGKYYPFEWKGQQLKTVFDILDSSKCFGSIKSVKPLPGYEGKQAFQGWARHGTMASANADWVLATNSTGIIIGLGAPGRFSKSGTIWLQQHFPKQVRYFSLNSGIAGYLSAKSGESLHFYTVKDNQACKFTTGRAQDE